MTDTSRQQAQRNGPIFIVGAPRSGTTLLQYRLRNHPRISLPTGESHFFIPLYHRQTEFGDLNRLENVRSVLDAMYAQSGDFLEGDLHGLKFDADSLAKQLYAEGRHTMPAIISGLFEKNAQGEGKARWGDKTPYYVMHISKLLEWFPDAQIVHLIRDGRDVALSLFGRQHDFFVYNSYIAAEYWETSVVRGHAIGKTLAQWQYLEMRYEDLLANPEETMKMLCDFLGEAYSDTLFNFNPMENPGKATLVYQPIKADNAGKWRSRMTPGQIKAFECVAGDTLRQFGYELTTAANPPSLPVKAAYRLHNQLLTAYWRYAKPNSK